VPAAAPSATADAIASGFGFLQHVLEEIANVVRNGLDHREDLFENISDQIRGRDPEILGEAADIVRQLLRDPRVQHPLLSRSRPTPAHPLATLPTVALAAVF
jgi:hypothetical protein